MDVMQSRGPDCVLFDRESYAAYRGHDGQAYDAEFVVMSLHTDDPPVACGDLDEAANLLRSALRYIALLQEEPVVYRLAICDRTRADEVRAALLARGFDKPLETH